MTIPHTPKDLLRRVLTALALASVCSAACGPQLRAQTPAAAADTLTAALSEATVYASSAHTVTPNQQLAGVRLEALRAHSIADALRYFCGVSLKDYGGVAGLKTIDVRSMGSNHSAVAYDGLQLAGAQNGQIDLGRYDLDDVERIDLYNGQKSDLTQTARDYGSSATVSITTRRPTFADSARSTHFSAALRTGSFGLVSPSLRLEQRLTPSVSASLSAAYTHAHGRYAYRYRKLFPDGSVAYDTTAVRQGGDVESGRLEASLFGSGRTPWTAKVYGFGSRRGIPGAVVSGTWLTGQRQHDRSVFAQGSASHVFSPHYSITVRGKIAHDYLRYVSPDSTALRVDNTFRQEEVYVSAAHLVTLGAGWRLSAAADWMFSALSADVSGLGRPRRNALYTALAARYDRRGLHLMASGLLTGVFDRDQTRVKATPAGFCSYDVGRTGLSLRAFAKQSWRMPTFNDLYYTDIGNARLRPECATQYDAGLLFARSDAAPWLGHVEVKADAYLNRITDKIVAVPRGTGLYRWMMQNVGRVRVRGVDAGVVIALRGPRAASAAATGESAAAGGRGRGAVLTACLNYTFQRAEDRSDPADCEPPFGTYGGQIAYIPRHSASAAATLSIARCVDINYSFVYVGERFHTSSNTRANYEPPWYAHDASLCLRPAGLRWAENRLWLSGLSLLCECCNLLDQQYDVVCNYPMPGRNVRFTLKFNL